MLRDDPEPLTLGPGSSSTHVELNRLYSLIVSLWYAADRCPSSNGLPAVDRDELKAIGERLKVLERRYAGQWMGADRSRAVRRA